MERYCSKFGKEAIDLTAVPPASVKGMPSTMWNKSPERREKGRAGDLKASQKCGCLEAQGERYSSEVLRTHTSQLPLMTHTCWEGWTKTDEQAYLTPARVSSWRICVYVALPKDKTVNAIWQAVWESSHFHDVVKGEGQLKRQLGKWIYNPVSFSSTNSNWWLQGPHYRETRMGSKSLCYSRGPHPQTQSPRQARLT